MRIQKYQSPANGIVKQDNTYVAKPIEQKSFKRVYQPKQAYLSQDNRTKLQHEQGQKKADEAYNQQMKDKNTAIALNHLLGFSNFADYVGLGLGASALAKYGFKQGVKSAVKASQKIGIVAPQFQHPASVLTERFLKFVGGHTTGEPLNIDILQGAYKLQAKKLQEAGVDLSKISFQDLRNSMNKRMQEIINTAPTDRFNMIVPEKDSEIVHTIYDYSKPDGNKVVGRTKIGVEDGDAHIVYTENVSNNPNIHKVEERGLNSAIQFANQTGLNGVVSGKQLLSAPKTYNVWKHFPEKEMVSNRGMHQNVNMVPEDTPMRFITEAKEMVGNSKESLHFPFGSVYRLRKPSSLETKTKSTIFDPTIIDNNGKMRIDWNDPNIFKAIGIPFVGGLIQKNNE